jgi:hypothetical protein
LTNKNIYKSGFTENRNMKCDSKDKRTLNFIEMCDGCSIFNIVNVPMVVQMCPDFAKFALMHMLSNSYIWTARVSCCLAQEAYSSIRNSRGTKSSGVHGIGLLWSIHQPMDFDYKTNMPPRGMCVHA